MEKQFVELRGGGGGGGELRGGGGGGGELRGVGDVVDYMHKMATERNYRLAREFVEKFVEELRGEEICKDDCVADIVNYMHKITMEKNQKITDKAITDVLDMFHLV
jgi:CobQ-like glutamine amidotransferase family enzyme